MLKRHKLRLPAGERPTFIGPDQEPPPDGVVIRADRDLFKDGQFIGTHATFRLDAHAPPEIEYFTIEP